MYFDDPTLEKIATGQLTVQHPIGCHLAQEIIKLRKKMIQEGLSTITEQEESDNSCVHDAVGNIYWYQHGKLHRDYDLPAILLMNGDQEWYQHGERHRMNNLPAVITATGTRYWYHRGQLSRHTGPAIIYHNGKEEWWVNGRSVRKIEV